MMSNEKAPTNAEKWFPGKKYFPIVVSTKKCPLTYSERVVYSYLVFRLHKEQTATRAKMVKVLRLAKNTVSKAVAELEKIGLVAKEQKWYRASKPDDAQKAWFAKNGRTSELWNRQFATYAVYCPKKGSGLSTKANALLWLLYSLAPKYGRPVVFGQHLAGLAAMLNMSEKGVKQGIDRLISLGLVERVVSVPPST
jgi:predicted transcriptional regulator